MADTSVKPESPIIRHYVEGFEKLTFANRTPTADNPNTYYEIREKKLHKGQKNRWQTLKDSFNRTQEMRMKIPSLPDTEALNLEGQKEAARRRMRGRSGTMLTERGL